MPASNEISVCEHGARPDGSADAVEAVASALLAARQVNDPIIVFPEGTYRFSPSAKTDRALIHINGFDSIEFRGENALLIADGTKALMLSGSCGKVKASGFSVDWDPLPYTAGTVITSCAEYIDICVDENHPLLEKPIELMITVDPRSKAALRKGQPAYLQYSQKNYKKPAYIIGANMLRIFLDPTPYRIDSNDDKQPLPIPGTMILAYYHIRGGGAFPAHDCASITYNDLTVYASAGMAFAARRCGDVSYDNCRVLRKNGRWTTSTVDASHSNMLRGDVRIANCTFEYMGDDGGNVHGMYTAVHERCDAYTIVLRGWGNPFSVPGAENTIAEPASLPRMGDILEFSSPEHRHVAAHTNTVAAVSDIIVNDLTLKKVALLSPLPGFVTNGTIVGNASDNPRSFFMENCTIRGNRGQGLRVKARNVRVENCTFEGIQGNGIWVFCDADYGHESIAAHNVSIRNNTFKDCARALLVTAGRKTPADPNVHEDITFEKNTVSECGKLARLQSAKNVIIRGNTADGIIGEPIEVDLCENVTIMDNEFK